jgi:squalene cyclase
MQRYFQEYDLAGLKLRRDANLIIQRILEYGTWEDIRWLCRAYSRRRVQKFLRDHGERWLRPVTFNYWRKLLRIRHWKTAPFGGGAPWIL